MVKHVNWAPLPMSYTKEKLLMKMLNFSQEKNAKKELKEKKSKILRKRKSKEKK